MISAGEITKLRHLELKNLATELYQKTCHDSERKTTCAGTEKNPRFQRERFGREAGKLKNNQQAASFISIVKTQYINKLKKVL